jgi:hypothetical protein
MIAVAWSRRLNPAHSCRLAPTGREPSSANDHGHASAHTLDNDNRSSFIAAARSDTTISPSGRPLAVRTPRSQPTTHGFQIPVARRAAPPDPCRPAVSFP